MERSDPEIAIAKVRKTPCATIVDGQYAYSSYVAVGGSITFTTIDSTRVAGTYVIEILLGETITGSFDVPSVRDLVMTSSGILCRSRASRAHLPGSDTQQFHRSSIPASHNPMRAKALRIRNAWLVCGMTFPTAEVSLELLHWEDQI
jgi:hypothetical protein